MYKPILHILHTFLLLVLIGTGSSIFFTLKNSPPALAARPEETRQAISPAPGFPAPLEATPDANWSLLQPGLERRVIQVYDAQQQPVEKVHIWRLDQKNFRLDVAFDASPKSLETWQAETNAALVVNAGYFSIANERYFADGRIVLDGVASGKSFNGFGGMLAVTSGGAELRWLAEKPYDPNEHLQAALQSFPMLVTPGGGLGFGPEREDHANARRTVIAQDRAGRILFIVTPQGYFTLHRLSVYLTESDLDLDIALNLDGGGSTGLLVAEPREVIPAKVLLPFVILVYAR
jgi:Phosphodiester glycosidase